MSHRGPKVEITYPVRGADTVNAKRSLLVGMYACYDGGIVLEFECRCGCEERFKLRLDRECFTMLYEHVGPVYRAYGQEGE